MNFMYMFLRFLLNLERKGMSSTLGLGQVVKQQRKPCLGLSIVPDLHLKHA